MYMGKIAVCDDCYALRKSVKRTRTAKTMADDDVNIPPHPKTNHKHMTHADKSKVITDHVSRSRSEKLRAKLGARLVKNLEAEVGKQRMELAQVTEFLAAHKTGHTCRCGV
jgi:ribosome-binding protein aMBF1 (putative translation factor)